MFLGSVDVFLCVNLQDYVPAFFLSFLFVCLLYFMKQTPCDILTPLIHQIMCFCLLSSLLCNN